MASSFDFLMPALVVGDSGVGKSCLLLRFTDNSYTDNFIATIGVDFKIKTVTVENKKIKLQIWDTAGQERFRSITSSYFRGAKGIVLVYDVTNQDSFDNVRTWVSDILQGKGDMKNTILVGNKCELIKEKVISTVEAKELADEYGIPFFECSAKNNININEPFVCLARNFINHIHEETGEGGKEPKKRESVVSLADSKSASPGKKSSCC